MQTQYFIINTSMGQYLLTDTDPSIIFASKSSPKLLLAVETTTTDKRTNVSSVRQFLRLLKQGTVKELALFSSFKLSKSYLTWLATISFLAIGTKIFLF